MKLSAKYLPHTVTVEAKTGHSSTGPVYADPVPLRCMADGTRRLVRGPDGNELVSSLTLICEAGKASTAPPGARVTWGSTVTTVVASTEHDDGGLGAPQHAEVVCE